MRAAVCIYRARQVVVFVCVCLCVSEAGGGVAWWLPRRQKDLFPVLFQQEAGRLHQLWMTPQKHRCNVFSFSLFLSVFPCLSPTHTKAYTTPTHTHTPLHMAGVISWFIDWSINRKWIGNYTWGAGHFSLFQTWIIGRTRQAVLWHVVDLKNHWLMRK